MEAPVSQEQTNISRMVWPSFFRWMGRNQRWLILALAVSHAGSTSASWNLINFLSPDDKISIWRGGALFLLGMVYFMSLFELMNMMVLFTSFGAALRAHFRLSTADVLDISNKAVSAVQAVLSCATGVVVLQWSCARDLVRTSHFVSEAYAWFGAAYFFYDIWSMYTVHLHMNSSIDYYKARCHRRVFRDGAPPAPPAPAPAAGDAPRRVSGDISFLGYCRSEPVILMHHLFIGGFGFLVIVYLRGGLGDCVFGFVYLMELSTPFVSFRGILSRLRMKASKLYLVNGIVMVVSFFACRVASLPYVVLMYSRAIGKPYFEALKSLPTGCKISIAILLLPQLYWFFLMSLGAVKVFCGGGKKGPKRGKASLGVPAAGDAAGPAGQAGPAAPGPADHEKRS